MPKSEGEDATIVEHCLDDIAVLTQPASGWSDADTAAEGSRKTARSLTMRLDIRLQLALLVLLAALLGLAVIALATWFTNYDFVLDIRSSQLSLTASLKANQIGTAVSLIRSSVIAVTTRVLIQQALLRYNGGNNTSLNWGRAIPDLQTALNGATNMGVLMQARILSRSQVDSGNNTILEATGQGLGGLIELPWSYADGSPVYLGDDRDTSLSYPSVLYPNLTYSSQRVNDSFSLYTARYGDEVLNSTSQLFLGPWAVNTSYSLASLTMPVINNTSRDDVLAWMTVVVDAKLVIDPIADPEGLYSTGATLLVGPTNSTNRLPNGVLNAGNNATKNVVVRFVVPPNNTLHRHDADGSEDTGSSFIYTDFPAVATAWTTPPNSPNSAGAILSTKNENGFDVGVGFARVPSDGIVDWLLLVEQAHSEVYSPISKLRKLLLACVFGTAGFVVLMTIPIAHCGTAPIRRLRDATRNSVSPPGYNGDGDGSHDLEMDGLARKEGLFAMVSRWRHQSDASSTSKEEDRKRRQFKIPAKVKDRKHWIHDELTDLTTTFNEMSDELMVNYEKLEERVQQRTIELEESKRAAEAANEAKTIFVANISHELKTPLNGILGIAQTAQVETSLAVLKRDMRIIYNQGDLLTKLIGDLLLFSKNQIDHQIGLEESEFRVRDITTQVQSTFQFQAHDANIKLIVDFEGPNDGPTYETLGRDGRKEFGPLGSGRVKDMVLWGDKTRLLQIVNNLTSNALKFTPEGGTVRVVVRCLTDSETGGPSRQPSSSSTSKLSRLSRASVKRSLPTRPKSGLNTASNNADRPVSGLSNRKVRTANEINAIDSSTHPAHSRAASPPVGARDVTFEWEVSDTGPGMSSHVQEKVFEPFFQGDMALSKKFQGTGLGLSICSQLSKLLGGSMWLHSEEGYGSTFTFRVPLKHIGTRSTSRASSISNSSVCVTPARDSFPAEPRDGDTSLPADSRSTRSLSISSHMSGTRERADSIPLSPRSTIGSGATLVHPRMPEPQSALDPPSPLEPRSLKILVAEDNKTNQLVVTRLLKMEKVTNITIAEDGKVALERVLESMNRGDNYDLIFMDVQMPNMDGLEATKEIRKAQYKGPIVALSAYSDEANVKGCHEAGMDDFVSKPIQLPRLKLVLRTFCPTEYSP